MEKAEEIAFLFDISKEVKHFYETPVIYLTKKDYSDKIFNAMCSIKTALVNNAKKEVIDIIVDFHLQWIHAVKELESFKKRIPDLPRENVYEAISYTIDVMGSRLKYYQRYMESYRKTLPNDEQAYLNAELEIVEEMHKEVTQALLDQLKCYRSFPGNEEFKVKVNDAVETLLQWLDNIHDSLATVLSNYININVPHLTTDLTKTLQQIVDDLNAGQSPSAQKVVEDIKERSKEIGTMIRCTASHDLEISKVVEKINILDDRIKRLESEPTSAAVLALTHKKDYLERRLSSLEKLKITLKKLHSDAGVDIEGVAEEELCICEDFYKFKIFNHLLPLVEREKLVSELCYLWDLAVFGEHSRKSIISILSAADVKEEFTDQLGTFYIDEHSRKIYRFPEDDTLYQLNEFNELVPLSDDADHIYFYDESGRYYVDANTRLRLYKAHVSASEYMMDSSGVMLKVKEERDGITYFYDNYGRYYVDADGKHVYRDSDTASEYENDGLGNLVRIRSQVDMFQLCPDDAHVTEDFKYLKQTVGPALRSGIADCILHQPADPIKYLSTRLIKFRENLEVKEKRARENEELFAEREIVMAEERAAAEKAAEEAAALLAAGGSEASYDSILVKYTTDGPGDALSVDATSAKI